jgi:hypothetical protein
VWPGSPRTNILTLRDWDRHFPIDGACK